MVLGLRTAIYPTRDLAAAKRWYTDMLGVAPYFDEPFYVGFSVGGFELGLLPDATPGTVGPQPLWGVRHRVGLLAFDRAGCVPVRTHYRGRRRHQSRCSYRSIR